MLDCDDLVLVLLLSSWHLIPIASRNFATCSRLVLIQANVHWYVNYVIDKTGCLKPMSLYKHCNEFINKRLGIGKED